MRKILTVVFVLLACPAIASSDVDQTVMDRIWSETDMISPLTKAPEDVRKDLACLALNVYHESRGSVLIDKVGTAFVAMNRLTKAYRGAKTICDVIWQLSQFSWTNDGRSDFPKDDQAWIEAQFVALMVFWADRFDLDDPTNGATHYVRHDIFNDVPWTKRAVWTNRLGDHIYMVIK